MSYCWRIACIVILLCMSFLSAAEAEVIRLGHVGHDHHLSLYLAAEMGKELSAKSGGYWLKQLKKKQVYSLLKDGTPVAQVQLLKVGGGSGMPSALASGKIDIGYGGLAPAVFAIDRGAAIKVIAPVNADGDMLVVKPGLPVKSWKEFTGYVKKSKVPVRIGYKAPRAVAYLIFIAALKEEGISFGIKPVNTEGKAVQVVMVNLQKGANMVPSLASGAVDGFVMNQPVVSLAEYKKVGRVVCELKDLPPEGKWNCHPCCCIAASEKVIKAKPEIVRGILALMSAAGNEIPVNRKTVDIAAEWTGKPLAVEKKSIPTNMFVPLPDAAWNKGMANWFGIMKIQGFFKGALKGLGIKEIENKVVDFSLLPQAGKAVK